MSRSAFLVWLAALTGVLLAALAVAVAVGAVAVPLPQLWQVLRQGAGGDSTQATIVWELRLPRVLLAAIVGAGLAAAGAAYQGLFRNPLADPFVIGASGGAALGAAMAIVLGLGAAVAGFDPVPLMAFAGTFAAVALVYAVGGLGPTASPLTLLLAGAAVSTVLSALVSMVILMDDRSLHAVYYWLLGGFSGKGWDELATTAAYLLPAVAAMGLLARPLDALAMGDETARSLGLPLNRARLAVVGSASLATAAAVAAGGVIGFIGLMAPHMARMLLGAHHARLIPASALLGAVLLVVADTLARTLMAPTEIPVGILTSLMGGPFFLYVLKRTGGQPGGGV